MKGNEELVLNLLSQGYIKSKKVRDAFLSVDRAVFVLPEYKDMAYEDTPLPILNNQTISAPHMVAMMTELLELNGREKVLEIGSGSGYQAAIISRLAKFVYTVEIDHELVEMAKANLKRCSIKNVKVIVGDGAKGYENAKPYDRVIVTCATPKIFDSWLNQLTKNGILLAPVNAGFYQKLVKVIKKDNKIYKEMHGLCSFVPLRRE
ncbi:MAG TPA: protein-L-isoaspartate(D-aspartate) O-methyltransferase [Candidatus Aenigmarchaeota archaeon]|nr:MAG: protein-L-isoaspartate O-methyltransferase [Candidatus Aenigmarchaeota archaeon]HDD45848.1 protein-L-isoaspartate(D-aspartate) O-methyltransferase [Candidatus Aenigmarchaeota archaeon]